MSMVEPQLVSSTAHKTPGATNEWETPKKLFEALKSKFGIVFDAAASPHNAKCNCYFSTENGENALDMDWRVPTFLRTAGAQSIFVNPPYGRGIGAWIKKAYEESRKGATVVVLVFCRTDTKWWHDYAMKASELLLIKGRVKFERDGVPQQSAPAPSCVLVFTPWSEGPPVTRAFSYE